MWAYRTKNREKGVRAPLERVTRDIPQPSDDGVQIEVKAVGVNRADDFIRKGLYKLDSQDSDILGTEVAGVITQLGPDVSGWKVGDEIFTVLPHGGAYSEYAVTPAGFLFEKPSNLSLEEAAALPVGLLTGWYNLVMKSGLKPGQRILIQGGSSGMGVLAIQIAQALGTEVFATAGGEAHCAFCAELGATAINYQEDDFVTYGPFKVIYDIMGGGDFFEKHIVILEAGGHLRVLSFLGGASTSKGIKLGELHFPGKEFTVSKANILQELAVDHKGDRPKLSDIMQRLNQQRDAHSDCIHIGGDAVRRWKKSVKAEVVRQIRERVMPLIRDGKIAPVVDTVYRLEDIAEVDRAHEHIATPNGHVGKLVLSRKAGMKKDSIIQGFSIDYSK